MFELHAEPSCFGHAFDLQYNFKFYVTSISHFPTFKVKNLQSQFILYISYKIPPNLLLRKNCFSFGLYL